MDQFMGFVPTADKNTVTTNYTGDRGVSGYLALRNF